MSVHGKAGGAPGRRRHREAYPHRTAAKNAEHRRSAPVRSDDRSADDERASERERSVRGGDAGRDQNQRRQDRGGVRRDAKQADVAVLDPVVPDVEGKADGSEAEAEDREPLAHVFGNDRRFKRRVAGGRERRGREAEPGNRFGWRALELAGKHRIAGPDEGAAKSEAVARERRAARDGEACAFGKKESRRSGEAERRAD